MDDYYQYDIVYACERTNPEAIAECLQQVHDKEFYITKDVVLGTIVKKLPFHEESIVIPTGCITLISSHIEEEFKKVFNVEEYIYFNVNTYSIAEGGDRLYDKIEIIEVVDHNMH